MLLNQINQFDPKTRAVKLIFIMASREGKTYCFYLAISALFDASNSYSC